MAYIKERGNNNYFVRVSCGILDNGRPFQKSRLFRPSRVNLPESKVRKELDAFVKALEDVFVLSEIIFGRMFLLSNANYSCDVLTTDTYCDIICIE